MAITTTISDKAGARSVTMNSAQKLLVLMGKPLYVNIPQYALTSSGTVFEDFENLTGWTGIVGTVESNTTEGEFRTGTQSVKFTTEVGSKAEATIPLSVNFGTAPRLRVSLYSEYGLDDWAAKLSSFRFYVYSGATYFTFSMSPGTPISSNFHFGWITFDAMPENWTNTGNDWTNVQDKIVIRITPQADQQIICSLDEIILNPVHKPCVLMTFDDANESVYTYAYQYLKTKRARGTFYVISDDIGTSPQVSSAQLIEMYNYGWSIGNHTSDHTNLTAVDEATAVQKIADCKTALDLLGFTRSSVHIAYPFGAHNETVQRAAATAEMLTGRTTNSYGSNTVLSDKNYHLIISGELGTSMDLATAKTAVDLANSTGRVIIFYGHILAESVAAQTWAIADFYALVDYIYGKGIPFLTINDYYDLQSAEKKVQI